MSGNRLGELGEKGVLLLDRAVSDRGAVVCRRGKLKLRRCRRQTHGIDKRGGPFKPLEAFEADLNRYEGYKLNAYQCV